MGGLLSGPEKKEDEHGEELQHCDTGDSLKVKQLLDEATAKAVLEKEYEEAHFVDNVKILLMTIACGFAVTAQFYPMPFPQSRPLLGVCCTGYFVFSGILQLVVKFLEREAVLFTKPTADGPGLRVSSAFPRFQSEYTIRIEHDLPRGQTGLSIEEAYCVGKFFDVDGFFWEQGFINTVHDLLARFQAKKSD